MLKGIFLNILLFDSRNSDRYWLECNISNWYLVNMPIEGELINVCASQYDIFERIQNYIISLLE